MRGPSPWTKNISKLFKIADSNDDGYHNLEETVGFHNLAQDVLGKQRTEKKDLKYKLICQGVENLIKAQGLDEEEGALWIDWQSIYQDDKVEKLKGVMSLIKVCAPSAAPTQ